MISREIALKNTGKYSWVRSKSRKNKLILGEVTEKILNLSQQSQFAGFVYFFFDAIVRNVKAMKSALATKLHTSITIYLAKLTATQNAFR